MIFFCSGMYEKKTNLLTFFLNSYNTIDRHKSKKELLWPLPGMYMNTSEYSKSFYFILRKRATSWQIAVFVNIYTLCKLIKK